MRVSKEVYMDLAQNGARSLVEMWEFHLVGGFKDEEETLFIIDIDTEAIIRISKDDAFEIMALALVEVEEEVLYEFIQQVLIKEDYIECPKELNN